MGGQTTHFKTTIQVTRSEKSVLSVRKIGGFTTNLKTRVGSKGQLKRYG